MPKKLRKTYGDVNSPNVVALKELIETQSKTTIVNWSLNYAESKLLPIFEKHCPDNELPRSAITAARDWLNGKNKLPYVKGVILECCALARELENNPIAQAPVRAIAQSASSIHAATHSLGLYFYAAAAFGYDRLGLNASEAEYAQIAEEVCADYTSALRAVSIENEPNPVRVKRGC